MPESARMAKIARHFFIAWFLDVCYCEFNTNQNQAGSLYFTRLTTIAQMKPVFALALILGLIGAIW
jgi:hypothetical protein